MRSLAREVAFAFSAWLVPFVVSVCIFPVKKAHPPLFESLMGVTLAAATVTLGCTYLRRANGNPITHGVRIGLMWMAANWLLDGLMFSSGPMKMSLGEYVRDIATAYLMIPVITIGLARAANTRMGKGRRAAARTAPPSGTACPLTT